MVGWHHPQWWTWVWVVSGSWWWTGKPGVLQSMGSQRVGHNWATELNWYTHNDRISMLISFTLVCSNSCLLSWWCYLTISSSVAPFSFCLQSFPASGFFPMSRLFESGGQSIGASASASVLLMNIQGWFPLGLIGLISLQSQGLSRVFCSTTVRRHQFFSV